MTRVVVNVDTFVRAETALQFDRVVTRAGGVNRLVHNRAPVALDEQDVIRMNRDTLYSAAVVDLAKGATLTIPDAGRRYLSVMALNEDHYINRIFHQPGRYPLAPELFDTRYVALTARILVDPNDPADVTTVNALQDALEIEAASAEPYHHPAYDDDSYKSTHAALLELAHGIPDTTRMFGARRHVDPVRHLVGTAFGWGGLPETEAFYVARTEPRPSGRYRMSFEHVPVDAFWSVTVYNRDGFLEQNPFDAYSVNSVTAAPDADGDVTLHLGPAPEGDPAKYLHVTDGWNYVVRLYRPHREVLDGTWRCPEPERLL